MTSHFDRLAPAYRVRLASLIGASLLMLRPAMLEAATFALLLFLHASWASPHEPSKADPIIPSNHTNNWAVLVDTSRCRGQAAWVDAERTKQKTEACMA